MPAEIRPAETEEMGAFRQVARRALLIPSSVAPPDAVDAIRPEWTLCAFEDQELTTSYAWWPLKMRLNGKSSPVAGITYVGTHPAFRRKGHLRKIVGRHFEIMHEEGRRFIAALHASRAAIYKRFGYAVVSLQNSYYLAPDQIVFARNITYPAESGRIYEPSDGGRDIIKDIYHRFCAERTGYIHRARATWDAGVLARPSEDNTLFRIVYEENGVPQGYVIYEAGPEKPERIRHGHRVVIRDMAWLSPGAYYSLWHHFSGMDLAGGISWPRAPADDPLFHMICEPGQLNIKTRDGLMARIVDAAGALCQRGYDGRGAVCFELEDELCPWNRGRWLLEVQDGEAGVRRTKKQPDFRLHADTLAMLFFGFISATAAWRTGLIDVFKPEAISLADRLFATQYQPFCPDFF
ncbi:MAG: GNAT family N-acetyltransferase [Desulfosalsimonas sp.]